jgi:hypothetical protein
VTLLNISWSLSQLICRYFGEDIDESDAATVKLYCNNMCDICKYPGKVRKRKEELSSQELACTQAPVVEASDDEDRPHGLSKPNGSSAPVRRNGSFNAWTALPPPARGSRLGSTASSSFGQKRASAVQSGASKKAKLATSSFNLSRLTHYP